MTSNMPCICSLVPGFTSLPVNSTILTLLYPASRLPLHRSAPARRSAHAAAAGQHSGRCRHQDRRKTHCKVPLSSLDCRAPPSFPYPGAMAIQIRTSLDETRKRTKLRSAPPAPAPTSSRACRAFKVVSDYTPSGDQPTAIAELVGAVGTGERDQVLLGRYRLGQDVHHGQGDRRGSTPRLDPRAEQNSCGTSSMAK